MSEEMNLIKRWFADRKAKKQEAFLAKEKKEQEEIAAEEMKYVRNLFTQPIFTKMHRIQMKTIFIMRQQPISY